MNDYNITLDILIKYLGQPDYHGQGTYKWQCPLCNDSHKDNLVYTENKGLLWCFASDGKHSKQILSEIFKHEYNNESDYWKKFYLKREEIRQNQLDEKQITQTEVFTKEKQKEFITYAAINTISLMGNIEAQTILLEKRGITKETAINVLLGYDEERKRWVIPTIKYSSSYQTHLIGFEYRPFDFNKNQLRREKNTPSALAQINAYNEQDNLVIVEGYFDGYALYQHLTEHNKINDYHIVTCSNGVGGLYNQLSIIDFEKYKNSYLLIDYDKTSIPIATKICNTYKNIKNLSPIMFKNCQCKDFNEHYLNCIFKKRISDRYDLDDLKQIDNINQLINYIKEKETSIVSEKINKGYSLEKFKTKENIITECVKYFNGQYNAVSLCKILTGVPDYYNVYKDNPKIVQSPFYKIFDSNEYHEIKSIFYKLIKEGYLYSQNGRRSGRLLIKE